jgi:hypothetical protein
MSQNSNRKRSLAWYALPAILSIIGGIIAFFILRQDDETKAKNCLWLGISLFVFYIGYYIVFSLMIGMFEFS